MQMTQIDAINNSCVIMQMTMITYIHIQQTLRFNSTSFSKTACMGLVYLSAVFYQ